MNITLSTKFSILLVDDHKLVRRGIRSILSRYPDVEVIAEANDGSEALAKIKELEPDILLLDISLPDTTGFEIAMNVKDLSPDMKIIFLSMHEEPEYIIRSIKSGGHGYVLKSAENDELIYAIRKVMEGEKYFGEEVSNILIESYQSDSNPGRNPKPDKHISLTFREKEILKFVADGHSTKEIAEQLYISPRTVETHRLRIMQKLEASNTAELIKLAVLYKLIEY